MKFKKTQNKYIIRLEKDEKIIETLTKFLNKQKIKSAHFTGIGAVSEAEIAHFNILKKEYSSKLFNEPLEIISLIGNIALVNNKTMIHAHISLADSDMKTHGGHLKEATVSPTCEIILEKLNISLKRKLDKATNLNLLDL